MKRYVLRLVSLAGATAMCLPATTIDARPIAPLYSFAAQHIYYMTSAMNRGGAENLQPRPGGPVDAGPSALYVNIHGRVGFDVPFAVNLSVVPEIELVWQKEYVSR